MRIIGGIYKSRLVEMPRGVDIRPTQDRVREAIFNILAPTMAGSSVLDLYAGSGASGLEALSRGAKRAVFIDSNPRCVNTIRRNIENLGIKGKSARVIRGDSVKALKSLEETGEKFDIVFLDPPYYKDIAKNCLINISIYDILAPIHRIVVEHHKKDILKDISGILAIDERIYGDTVISIFKKKVQ